MLAVKNQRYMAQEGHFQYVGRENPNANIRHFYDTASIDHIIDS